MTASSLRIQTLTAGYRGQSIVHEVTLSVGPGEIVAVLGLNGCGKSTLLRAVMGVAEVVSGAIRLCDEDVHRVPVHVRARRWFGFLAQGGPVFPSLTVEEHVRRGLRGLSGSGVGSALAEAFERLPTLKPVLTRRTSLLSAGYRQLVALATALAAPHAFLLLDEPTASLAADNVDGAVAWIQSRARDGRSGVLLVEQNLRVAGQLADRIVVLAGGRIASCHEAPVSLDARWFERLLDRNQGTARATSEAVVSEDHPAPLKEETS